MWFDFHSLLNKWNHFCLFFCVLLLMMLQLLLVVVRPFSNLFSYFRSSTFSWAGKKDKEWHKKLDYPYILACILPFLFIRLDDCNGSFPLNAPTEDEKIFSSFFASLIQRNSLIYFVLLSTSLSILWTIDLLLLKFIFYSWLLKNSSFTND